MRIARTVPPVVGRSPWPAANGLSGPAGPTAKRPATSGFTLLEVLVATLILGIAVVGLLSNITTSMRNAARVTDYDRASMVAKRKMEELLTDQRLPRNLMIQGPIHPTLMGGQPAGWRGRLSLFEAPPSVGLVTPVLDRLELEIWWGPEENRRSVFLESFREGRLSPEEAQMLRSGP
jgi:general secretion pathway protein I